jgi:hypothetical protein
MMLKHKPSRVICEVGVSGSTCRAMLSPLPFGFMREAPGGVRGAPRSPPAGALAGRAENRWSALVWQPEHAENATHCDLIC